MRNSYSEDTESTYSSDDAGTPSLQWCGAVSGFRSATRPGDEDVNSRSGATPALNPFRSYDKSDEEWPNVFDELDEMVEICTLMYPHTLLRQLVKEKRIKDKSLKLNTAHLTALEVTDVIIGMKKELEDTLPYEDQVIVDTFNRMLEVMQDRKMISERQRAFHKSARHISTSSLFVTFGDEIGPADLAYSVNVDKERQRITMWFRGFRRTMFNEDWTSSRDIIMKEEPNPMKRHSTQRPTMKINNRVHSSLFCPFRNQGGKVVSQYQNIMLTTLQPLINRYPGFKLYVTGHSSGGALATMFAVEAAAEPDSIVPKPVTCVSIGSPYVGNNSFRASHQLLEGLGKLRHLRVSNHKDTVTVHPNISFRWNLGGGEESHIGTRFKHVGMNLRLFQKGREPHIEMSYPKVRTGIFGNTFDEVARGWENSLVTNFSLNPIELFQWPHHGLREYSKRVKENRTRLGDMALNTFYSNPGIVGSLASYH